MRERDCERLGAVQESPSQFVYLNHLASRLRAAGREEGEPAASPYLREARDTFEALAALMATQPMYQQSLPQLHQSLAELCHELGDEPGVRACTCLLLQPDDASWSPSCVPLRPHSERPDALHQHICTLCYRAPRVTGLTRTCAA